jgi:hypothetical protein
MSGHERHYTTLLRSCPDALTRILSAAGGDVVVVGGTNAAAAAAAATASMDQLYYPFRYSGWRRNFSRRLGTKRQKQYQKQELENVTMLLLDGPKRPSWSKLLRMTIVHKNEENQKNDNNNNNDNFEREAFLKYQKILSRHKRWHILPQFASL